MPKDLSGCLFLHMVQIHFAAQLAVVAFGGFFEHMQVSFELFLVGKCNPIDPLQHRPIAVAAPIGAGHTHQFEPICGHLPCVLQMWSTAQILPVTMPIHSQRFVARDGVNQLHLIGLSGVGIMLHRARAIPNFGADCIALIDDFLHLFLNYAQVFWGESLFAIKVIIPAVFDHRTDRHLHIRPNFLNRTGHDMGQIMPDQLIGLDLIFHGMNRDRGVGLNGPSQIKMGTIHRCGNGFLRQRTGDISSHFGGGDAGLIMADRIVGKGE